MLCALVPGVLVLVRVAVTVASAFLLASLVAPRELAYLHWGALAPLFWALRADTPRANRWLAFLFGTVAEALIFSWIAETISLFSNIPAPGAWAILVLFASVYGLQHFLTFAMVHPLRRRLGDLWMLGLPAWLVLVEFVGSRVNLFPYQQGISQFQTPWVWQIASVTGVWGLSFLVQFVNCTLGEAIYRHREGRALPVRWMGAAAVAVALTVVFGAWRHAEVEAVLAAAPTKQVLQIQSDKGMEYRMSHPAAEGFDYWVGETARQPRGSVDLAVWPEGAVPYQLNASTVGAMLWDLTATNDLDLIVGAGTRERAADVEKGEKGKVRVFNSTYFFDRAARAVPADAPGPEAEVAALAAAGCDLTTARLLTWFEADRLARAGEGTVDPACVTRLRERASELGRESRVDGAFADAMRASPTLWPRLRKLTGRFTEPLVERGVSARRGAAQWTLHEAGCLDDDCRGVSVRCIDEVGCDAFPEAPHYDKMVPLPFGEYLPFAETFPWLADLIEGPGNFRAGTEPLVFETEGVRFATPICYEGILDYVCDRFVDIDLLVNVTNDAWFGTGSASRLHGMLVSARAIELGLPVFRSAYTGTSFVVEPHGRIHDATGLFEAVARPVTVRLGKVDTVYARFGDWFVVLCAVLLGALLALRRGRPA